MYYDQKINLHFSLLHDYATVASKQFKMLKRIYDNNLNNQLFPYINFPSKQNCLEVMAHGFGYSNYGEAKKAQVKDDLCAFELPVHTLKDLFYKLNSELDEHAGYYYMQWLKMCLSVFSNIFSLKHSTLCLYDHVHIAKFENFGLIYEIFPFNKLLGLGIGEPSDATTEPEDALFVLNLLSLIAENKAFQFEDKEKFGNSKEEDAVVFKYRDIFRKRPSGSGQRHIAIDYVTDALFDSAFAVFVMQVVSPQDEMDTTYRLTLTDVAFKGLMLAKSNQRNINVCKKVLNKIIEKDRQAYGFTDEEELCVGSNMQYLELLRKALVYLGCLDVDENTEWLMLPDVNAYENTTNAKLEAVFREKLNKMDFVQTQIGTPC